MYGDIFDNFNPAYLQQQSQPDTRPKVRVKFQLGSQRARSAYDELRGHPSASRGNHQNQRDTRTITAEIDDVVFTLRKHGGLGGNLAANVIEGVILPMDGWEVDWDADTVAVRGIVDEKPIYQRRAYFDKMPFAMCPNCASENATVRQEVPVSITHTAVVDGATPELTSDAVSLVLITVFRIMPSLQRDIPISPLVGLPIGDDELATILNKHFFKKPSAVAEALLALHADAPKAQQWLLDTLENYPVLELLAAKVGNHLAFRPDVPEILRRRVSVFIPADFDRRPKDKWSRGDV